MLNKIATSWLQNQKQTWGRVGQEGLLGFIRNSNQDIERAEDNISRNVWTSSHMRGRGYTDYYERLMKEFEKPITESTGVLVNGQVARKFGDYMLHLKRKMGIPLTKHEQKSWANPESPESNILYRVD